MMKWNKYMYMKTFKFAALGLVTLAAVACSKELNNDTTSTDVLMEPIVLHAVQDSTKTHIESIAEGKATINWDNGDAISFFSIAQGGNVSLTASNISGASADFSGDIPSGTEDFAAVYPYTSGAVYSSGTITGFSIPTTQTATAGSFANGAALAIAKGKKTIGKEEVTDLQFKNLCSVIGFTLPSNVTFANEITISTKNGEKLAGVASIDYGTPALTLGSSASNSIVIKPSSGNFTSGKTYYVTIAPGTYKDGFNFSIKTAGGSTYTRTTTKTVTAVAGGIYPLGTLSLILGTSDFTSSVTLTNTFSNGELSGTDAKLSITPKSEIAGTIKSYRYDVNFYDATTSTTYRSLKNATATPTNVTLTQVSGKPYIPKGSYSYTVTLYYTTNNGTKDVERGPVIIGGGVAQNAPTGLNIQANLAGYTSYSMYKGTDGQSASANTANSKDNATIYGIGATYTKGVTSAVLTQCSNLWSFGGSKLDGNAKTGDASGQSWAEHTISADWSFDGTSGTLSKKVYVTGLPYKVSSFSANGDTKANDNYGNVWERGSWNNKVDGSALQCGAVTGSGSASWSSTFHFYVPSSINVTLSCPGTTIYTYKFIGLIKTTFEGYVNGTKVFSQTGPNSNTTSTYSPSGSGAISSNNDVIKLNSTYTSAGPNVHVYNVQLLYR